MPTTITAKGPGAVAPTTKPGVSGVAAVPAPGAKPTTPATAMKPGAPAAMPTPGAPVAPGLAGLKGPDGKPINPSAIAPPANRSVTSAPTVTTLRAPGLPATGPSAAKPVPPPTATPVDEQVTYQYNALGRRDPFMPLTNGSFVAMDEGGNAPPDVGGIKIVGIVWGAQDKFALAEDPRGESIVLRRGDKVMNGTVEGLKRDAVIVKLVVDGMTELVEIPVTRKGE
jgi:hypothetical protein